MTIQAYNPFIPQPPDLPSDNQPDIETNFLELNETYGVDHIPFGNIIEFATLAAPCVCTSTNHRLATGNTVIVFNMEGTNELGVREDWPINGMAFVVTVIDDNTFSLNGTDSTLYPTYLPNSGDFSSVDLPYGFHTKTLLNTPIIRTPNRAPPKSAYFSQLVENLPQLFFQNGATADDIVQLTKLPVAAQTGNGRGFRTPWGYIINVGEVAAQANTFTIYDFPLPFTSLPFSLTLSRGRIIIQSGTQGTNPVGSALTNTQFQVQYQRSGTGNFRAYIEYLAIGI